MSVKVSDMIKKFNLSQLTENVGLDNTITNVYIGDLLSWVMGKAKEGNAWITIQGHVNIVAVALLTGASCIIVAEGAEVTSDTIEKANKEEIPVLTTNISAYELASLFITLGV